MANEFTCSDCNKDGTRCRCHEKRPDRPYHSEEQRVKDRIEENERELHELERQMNSLRRRRRA